MRDNLATFCEENAKIGMIPIVEFMPERTLSNFQLVGRLLREIGEPRCGIVVDAVHWARGGGQPSDFASEAALRFPIVLQIADGFMSAGASDPTQLGVTTPFGGRRALPGEGNLNLSELVAALPEDVTVSIEVQKPSDDPMSLVEWTKHALTVTRQFLEAAELARGG